jgi:DNA repair exonuclease SbcCD ATPase subunit
MSDDDQQDDRRGLDRRLTQLEQQHAEIKRQQLELTLKVDGVGREQVHQRDLINMRFATLEKGQEVAVAKLDGLNASITLMASDQGNSPAGRALTKDIADLKTLHTKDVTDLKADHAKDCSDMRAEYTREISRLVQDYAEMERSQTALATEVSEFRGALKFASRRSIAGVLLAIAAIVTAALKVLGVMP